MEKINYGDGYGYGSGYGDGSGDGSGDGDGSGNGSGYGYGSGITRLCGDDVYQIDGVATIIKSVRGNISKGFIVKSDLTLQPCFIAKCGDFFAHGDTAAAAMRDARDKHDKNLPPEYRVEAFLKQFPGNGPFKTIDLFHAHKSLTGSCEFGRRSFCHEHRIDLDGEMTLDEFLQYSLGNYGHDVIKFLEAEFLKRNDQGNEN